MDDNGNTACIQEIMLDFAARTGLSPASTSPTRYLWTDAFAVCNFLELFRRSNEQKWLNLALQLVDQVHHILGQRREDEGQKGWISGLSKQDGEEHPTKGGLRIGKPLPERGLTEPYDERNEWDQDGQYFHYLTKWMHALNRMSCVTGDAWYNGWAIELAKSAHAGFTYTPRGGSRKRIYWKMSIDLSRPQVPSMGQHDPLDAFITYNELEMTASRVSVAPCSDLNAEIADMVPICRCMNLVTDDPLGTGGLLADATRIANLMVTGKYRYANLLENVMNASLQGIVAFSESDSLRLPAGYRLAFRELGLSIGLRGAVLLEELIRNNPGVFDHKSNLPTMAKAITGYLPQAEMIEQFWRDERNRMGGTWRDHLEINRVMLATSLAPGGFLAI